MKLLAALLLTVSCALAATETPNLLLVIADDCTYSDMELYGGQAKTPHLKQLATEGMTFSRCFQAAPMCSPTRHCLYTGLYPVKSGAYPNHTFAHDWVKSLAHYLQSAGYRTHLSGKKHISPKSVFPFEYSGAGNNPDPKAIAKLFTECARDNQPFLLLACSNEPHGPYTKGDPSAYPEKKLNLPPIWVDTPDTRSQFSKYLAEITYYDSQVGEILGLLEKHGHADNTLVIVLSEQGNGFPFAKWTCYDVGLRSGCVARWPGKIKPGTKSGALIEYVDVTPTFLEAAGVDRPEILDGKSLVPLLTGATDKHKRHSFGLQTTRGINSGSDHYGIRSIRDQRFRYIRNLSPEATFQNGVTQSSKNYWASWVAKAEAGDPRAKSLVHDYQHRPAEELYDCESDPWNRTNLAADPEHSAKLKELSGALDGWMKSQGDKGHPTELAAHERQGRSRTKKQRKK